ncbi:O-antigen ligase family protein [Confluentibacter sediminis]|uniref:O-antigen ligase family protein n=1 Tax=Confluentibacter sediminis TaxID=2219045 RepID=UPI000DACBE22|nr:O-antigen ligase family protein [Confluentibacter sediminis]
MKESTNVLSSLPKSAIVVLVSLLFLVLPQINLSGYVQPTVTSKFICFQYSCLVLLCLYSFKTGLTKTISFSLSKLDIVLFIFVAFITLNRYVIQTDFGFSIRFMELVGLGVLYIVLRNFSNKNYVWLLLTIVVSSIIQAIYGNLQLLEYYPSNHSGFRMTGSFFNPGPYAGFLSAVWPITLGMYLFKANMIEQMQSKSGSVFLKKMFQYIFDYIPLLGVVSILLVIPASQSRASWLAVLISSCLLLEYRYRVIKTLFNKYSNLTRSILITGCILIIGLSLLGVYHFKKGSSDGRLFIWKVSTEIIKENTAFGVGFDRFKTHYMNQQADYFSQHGETEEALVVDNTYYAFNEFIQFITEEGVLGFIILLFVLFFIIKIKTAAVKERNELGIIIKMSLLSIGVFAFFSYPMEILPIKLIMIVLLACLATLDQNKIKLFQNFKISAPINLVLKTSLVFSVLLASFFSFKSINRLNNSFKNWEFALNSYQYGDYESAIQQYEEAYPELKNNGDFLMNYGKALSIYKQNKKAIQILEEAKKHLNTTIIETALGDAYKNTQQYEEAEIAYKHAANMIPSRFYPLYLMAKLYDDSGQKEKAVNIAKAILDKDVKVSSTAIREIKQEMKDIMTKNKLFN